VAQAVSCAKVITDPSPIKVRVEANSLGSWLYEVLDMERVRAEAEFVSVSEKWKLGKHRMD